ncbi:MULTISPECIES: glycosyltransferase family 4 protein [Niastella]|uniref:Glycosyltransferase family 4 protein n=1 Tax=Niastella soli TaxID=2821487 RepID=A0ABS3YSL5_9BACT|nr:glycosyltransferase family 4 protein [Niastella soli]MBO9200853.1 glycosyltransferase family 4 protein [Niastella soli]
MKRPRVLFIVQLPPPVHGVTVMNQHTVDNPHWQSRYDIKTLPLHFGQKLDDIGKITPLKMMHMVWFLVRLCGVLISFRPSLVYFTIVPTGKIFYRDALITALIKLFRRRIVFHLHKRGIEEMARDSRHKRWLLQRTFRKTKIICLSKKLTADIRTVYKPEPFVLPNGIEVVNKQIVERDPAAPRILYLSNLVINKGIEVFLQSLTELHKQGCRFTASVVGGPVDYTIDEAKAYCARSGIGHLVDITGPRFGPDKFAELAKADIFVLPSFSECVPLTILEAMQFGLPVVATSVGGIPDILQDGVNGLLVQPGSVPELTARLQQLLVNKKERIQMGYSARERFIQKYTLAQYYEGMTDIFEQVLQDKPGH